MDEHDPTATAAPPARIADYFRARWNGALPLATLFWRDMLVVGTIVNVASTLLAVLLLALDVPAPVAVAVHFSPVPWNIFLFASLWRATARLGPASALAWQAAGTAWLLVATIV